ncbi:glycosyltransferase involved in cell wall biosynthesis [Amaricoccus macauensis]|uniref:Glycosyltransferase involved in cell wall biosynthesis n=1 Tax=Amaricoccus macauensis TaxID=57001 RepID=A0A840ST89_9RHOB|nr:glycosyltransferase [Amaricoccus macauensis]MBB5224394.1 glycosyltransferase involved in cell wall biosynthesis [Amaricoccus macauensis]
MRPADSPPLSPSSPPVTVVIPAYERAATIVAAIDSVLRQTRTDFELLVIDDGSSDGTAEAAETVADPRLRVVRLPKNRGAAGARNAGAAEARGRWIAFQDSDDEWLPEKLALQLARLEAHPDAIAAYCGLLTVGELDADAHGRTRLAYVPGPEIELVEGRIQPTLLMQNVMSTQTVVVRRDVFLALGGFDESLPAMEDWEFAIRLAGAGEIAFVDAPLVHQRFSPNSLTRNLEKQLRSHAMILEKSRPLYAGRPDLLARQYYILAGDSRRSGDLDAARCYLALARAARPGQSRPIAMSLYVAGLRLARALRRQPPDAS